VFHQTIAPAWLVSPLVHANIQFASVRIKLMLQLAAVTVGATVLTLVCVTLVTMVINVNSMTVSLLDSTETILAQLMVLV